MFIIPTEGTGIFFYSERFKNELNGALESFANVTPIHFVIDSIHGKQKYIDIACARTQPRKLTPNVSSQSV